MVPPLQPRMKYPGWQLPDFRKIVPQPLPQAWPGTPLHHMAIERPLAGSKEVDRGTTT